MITQDHEDDDDSRDEDPDPSDMDDEDSSDEGDLVPCPFCEKSVIEDADVCPHCGNFIAWSEEKGPRRWIWAMAAGLVVAGMLAWVLRLIFAQ